MSITLNELRIYPIKSTAGQKLQSATVESRGLRHDRRWMLVDRDGRFLTGRRFPVLTQVHATPEKGGLEVRTRGRAKLWVPFPDGDECDVRVWRDRVSACDAGDQAAEWFSDVIGYRCRLVYMADHHRRIVSPEYGREGDLVSFADGYPQLLISEASLSVLNDKLDEPVSMWRFRPNLVVQGCDAFAEDQWRRIAIGEVEFEVVKACSRCVFTTIDPETGLKHPKGEPFTTLSRFRRGARDQVLFGQNLVARSEGLLQHGDSVKVLETK